MRFEWDQNKDAANRSKHGIGFDEAASVFQDPRSRTVHDLRHSDGEDRYLTLGFSDRGRLLIAMTSFGSSEHACRTNANAKGIQMTDRDPNLNEMPTEVDFSDATKPTIGKYSDRFKGEVRMVVLDQDIAARFPDSASVNDALRSYLANAPAPGDG